VLRITDLPDDGVQLAECALLRRGAHPVERVDAVAEGGEDVLGHLLVALLRARGEVLRDVELAERVAEEALFLIERALPPRAARGDAVQGRAEEVEVLRIELAARFRGEVVGELPAEIRLPLRERTRLERLLDRLEELRLPDDDGIDAVDLRGGEVRAPADRR